MKVISINKIKEAQIRYPVAVNKLCGLYQILSRNDFRSEAELRATFDGLQGSDYEYSFPVPGTTIQVHTLVNFESQVAFIKDIMPGNQ